MDKIVDRNIIVEKKMVFGEMRFFPKNHTSSIFSRLMNKKTFDKFDLEKMRVLGYKISQYRDPVFTEVEPGIHVAMS